MQLIVAPDDLRPLIEATVASVLDRFGNPDRIAYAEPESAALFGLESHVLRDARLRGELTGSKLSRGYFYDRRELLRWFHSKRKE